MYCVVRYADLFGLNPIETVIELNDADNKTKARRLVATFVMTPSLEEQVRNVVLPQLDFSSGAEGKGLFFVGTYGTGKSHAMSFLSVVAENEAHLKDIRDDRIREMLGPIAGKFHVKRLQITGTLMSLYDIVADQLTELGAQLGFAFQFKSATQVSNVKTEFRRFMQAFDQHFPGKGVLLVFDELLHYLETRDDQSLVLDLSVLQALGEFSGETSRFVFMAGIQQALFNNPRFNHMASAVNRVRQRFNDFVIDAKGVEQLIEQYLFQKTDEQREAIRNLLTNQAPLFEVLSSDLDRFVALFPAHPRFIDEFQRVFVVERREILTILSKEARELAGLAVEPNRLELITADKYWKHIERDQGLKANRDVARTVQSVSTVKSHIQSNFPASEDKDAAIRLIHALAVNRLTTPSVTDAVGLTPSDLKNNLLWRTDVAVADANFLTLAAKRLLDRSREAVNGQFLTASSTSGQYYIDPSRDVDYEQHVIARSKALGKYVVQRYLNEIVTRALEIDNTNPIIEGRLWEYNLVWLAKNVERPGWLFFGFPNQRSTAKPPKDFYVFLVPSRRITGEQEHWVDAPDEAYWFIEDFPSSNCETGAEDQPDQFLDLVRKYAAARERGAECRGDEKTAFERIAKRLLDAILPAFIENANQWISVQYNGQKKRFGEWVMQLVPSQQNALFSTKFNAILQVMFATHFEHKYPAYPDFGITIREHTRPQEAAAALEIICGTGMQTRAGRAVLNALKLYDDVTPTPERSLWLQLIQEKLAALPDNQVLNNVDLFEWREERAWLKGEPLEAEWVLVVLAAGIEAGYLTVFGQNNVLFDASNLREFYQQVKNWGQVIRVAKPVDIPLEKWRKLFGILGINKGLLATPTTHITAVNEFQVRRSQVVEDTVAIANRLQLHLPFMSEASQTALESQLQDLESVRSILGPLAALNSKARMTNLRLDHASLDMLEALLRSKSRLGHLISFMEEHSQHLAALVRYEAILASVSEFQEALECTRSKLNAIYQTPSVLEDNTESAALSDNIRATLAKGLLAYRNLQRKHSLDREAEGRKKRLLQSAELHRLNKLARIRSTLNKAALEEVITSLNRLIPYHSSTDDELLRSPTSLCPHTKFDPRNFIGIPPAAELLERCEQQIEQLHSEWTNRLVADLKDDAINPTLNALTSGEEHVRQVVEAVRRDEALPAEIDDAFIEAVNVAFRGLRRRAIKPVDFVKDVLGSGGVPIKTEELRRRFSKWLEDQLGQDQPETVRFVVEE